MYEPTFLFKTQGENHKIYLDILSLLFINFVHPNFSLSSLFFSTIFAHFLKPLDVPIGTFVQLVCSYITNFYFINTGVFSPWIFYDKSEESFFQWLKDVWSFLLTGWLLDLHCTFIRDALNGTKADREQAGADSFTPVTAD